MIRSRPSDPDCGRVRVADKPFTTDFLTPLLPSEQKNGDIVQYELYRHKNAILQNNVYCRIGGSG